AALHCIAAAEADAAVRDGHLADRCLPVVRTAVRDDAGRAEQRDDGDRAADLPVRLPVPQDGRGGGDVDGHVRDHHGDHPAAGPAAARRQRRVRAVRLVGQVAAYLVVLLGAAVVAVPIYWMFTSALKTSPEILAIPI